MDSQLTFFGTGVAHRDPPSTRYQGSKLKLLPWIMGAVSELSFDTALDAFGGTASVSYAMKSIGKTVTYNDYLRFNQNIGFALVENQQMRVHDATLAELFARHPRREYDSFVSRTFTGVYFTDEENEWIDTVAQNIRHVPDRFERALAYYALYQACISKRPYNLFHRANLYMRTAKVDRGFGNKTTWDKPFEDHFLSFIAEANRAVFDSGTACRAVCEDALSLPLGFDLVYIDTPYFNSNGVGVDYHDFYHFLEGLTDYDSWAARIDQRKKHRPLLPRPSAWSNPKKCRQGFADLFDKFRDSILVVSYRSDGIPSEDQFVDLLRSTKRRVRVLHYGEYKYVLSTNTASKEILLIAE